MRQNQMRKSYGTVFLIVTGLVAVAMAADTSPEGLPIERIDVAGNVTLTRAEVLSVVRARPGQVYNAATVTEDKDRIGKLEAVVLATSDFMIKDNKVILTYRIEEKNLVRTIAFKGNKAIKDLVLTRELSFKRGDYLDLFAVRAGVDAIKEKYKKKGFPWAEVALDEGAVMLGHVTYRIEEGPRPKVSKVNFVGNNALSDRQLQGAIKTRKRKLLFFTSYYAPGQLETDTEKLLEVYQRKSFLHADVTNHVDFNEDKSKAAVTFFIEEGPAYFVDSIHYTGNQFFTAEQLQVDLKLRPNYFYSEAWAKHDAEKIESKYKEQGFIEAKVQLNPPQELADARVRVDYEIVEGDRFRIGEVQIAENSTYQDRTIRRIMDEEEFSPGNWYNADTARGNGEGELEKIIKQSVVAESATIQSVGDAPDRRDALVTVTEGQTGSIMVGAGIASDDGLVGQVSLTQRNFDITDVPDKFSDIFTGRGFRGAGQQLRLVASPGTEYSNYSISFTEPYLYDQPVKLNMSGSLFDRIRETYDEERLTGRIGLQKRYSDDWRRGVEFRAEDVRIKGLDWDAPQDVVDVEGSNMLFGARFYVSRDKTDSRFLPSTGYNFDVGYEQVVGDHTFGLLEGTVRRYKTLWEDLEELKTVLETKIKAGTTVSDTPTFERYYLGGIGEWALRGFEYRGVSPRGGPSDEPIGSDWAVVGNAEVSVPLGSETFSWLFFTDAGLIDEGSIRASVGTGVQIKIPQFFGPVPMRFELAVPLMKESGDETQPFSFSVGALF